mmetsp:Transcript_63478/g.183994  ORF Transcript_63478/g.183994 Transcript_63478/m.183994 type:complete len:263 (+) Transcript_63478:175-963(+)
MPRGESAEVPTSKAVGFERSGGGGKMAKPAAPVEPEPEPKTVLSPLTPPSPSADRGETVFFFDWDDTLLCTSFLDLHNLVCDDVVQVSSEISWQLSRIQKVAVELLREAEEIGHVFIVTNAMEGWVELSAARWLPELVSALRNVTIVPMRASKGDARYEGEATKWKEQAFIEIVNRFEAENETGVAQVIAMGDSECEIDAARAAGAALDRRPLVKTVKLKPTPSAEELSKELQVVLQSFRKIAEKPHDLKISLERKCAAATQ